MEFANPFRPGAGHKPPYLAGRQKETEEFRKLLKQDPILDNFILTGLRGVGKTVLLDDLKPLAVSSGWKWVGADLSEATSVSEENMAIRLLADLSLITSSIEIAHSTTFPIGFNTKSEKTAMTLNFSTLKAFYENTPGLTSDKLKFVLEFVYKHMPTERNRVIFAYDEAQNLSDNAKSEQYPLSLLLDVFASIQRKNIPFMLVLVGLPTLFPKLVEARTFSERMFRVVFLDKLSKNESREAINKPLQMTKCPVEPTGKSIDAICDLSGGYPYFIQYIGREVYDIWVIDESASIPVEDITYKLDSDFFAGRWDRATDRQRDLMVIIARLENADTEFSVQEIVALSSHSTNPFSPSHVNQMLVTLAEKGLIYKNRHGKYSFAVPLLGQFIRRQEPGMF